jgi:PA14 domain
MMFRQKSLSKVAVRLVVAVAMMAMAAVLAAPRASASPAAQSTIAWSGSYYANPDLQGDPAFTRDDPAVDFTWGDGSPGGGIPADDFSARWTRWVSINTLGEWKFTTIADGGVRLFVDDNLVIDARNDQAMSAHTVALDLTQSFHLVRMEYTHHTGNAEAHLVITSASYPDWRGEYYSNPDLVGTPVFVRNDSAINFDFGTAGPGGGIPGTNFSVRWTSSPYFDAGAYRFTMTVDDGGRLWVDNHLLVDQWHDQTPTTYSADVQLSAGYHFVKMEFYQHGSGAQARLNIARIDGAELWHGEYFENPGLQGSPALTRDNTAIDFDWGSAPPGSGIARGINWSARWTARRNTVDAGYYTVAATADDGVRVYVDNAIVIDQWHDASSTTYTAMTYLTAGAHDWRVEFYQHAGTASLHLQILSGAVLPPSGQSPGDVVVDTRSADFTKGGASAWQTVPNGNGSSAFKVLNNTYAQAGSHWARWYATLPSAGYYEVSVYLPANIGTTRNAQYWIAHGGAFDFRSVNQSLYSNQWVPLGAFYFDATGNEYVTLSDVTYEPSQSTAIAVDAVRFSAQ